MIANAPVTTSALNAMNSTYGTSFSLDDLVINKGYADGRYLRSAGAPGVSGQVHVRPNVDASGYTFTTKLFQTVI